MANNDRKQSSKFFAPRWGAISYVFIFLSLSTSYGGTPQKSTKNHKKKMLRFFPRSIFTKIKFALNISDSGFHHFLFKSNRSATFTENSTKLTVFFRIIQQNFDKRKNRNRHHQPDYSP